MLYVWMPSLNTAALTAEQHYFLPGTKSTRNTV